MRSYGQYCGLARALDVVGDRWSLLIVRELLLQGPARYTDLRHGLPGIATNLLVDRLRELEEASVVAREEAPPPVATTLFRLTPRGEALDPVIRALGTWAAPLMGQCRPDDEFRSHWLVYPLEMRLSDRTPDRPPVTIEVRTADQPMLVETVQGKVRVRPGSAEKPDAVITATPDVAVGLLVGRLTVPAARARGAHVQGSLAALERVRPPAR